MGPKKDEDGSISCHSVEGLEGEKDSHWNYVLSKNGWYIYASGGADPREKSVYDEQRRRQTFYMCPFDPELPYPATMWVSKCVREPKRPFPTPPS